MILQLSPISLEALQILAIEVLFCVCPLDDILPSVDLTLIVFSHIHTPFKLPLQII